MFTATDLIEAQNEIGVMMGYPWTGDRKRRYTAILFSHDLNALFPVVVKITNGKPHQMYHARRGAMCVPPVWEHPVKELLKLARSGFSHPPTPRRRSNRG